MPARVDWNAPTFTERRQVIGTITMRSQRPAVVMLCAAIAVLMVGFVMGILAQAPYPTTQDGINAMVLERMRGMSDRQDNIEGMLKFGLLAIAGNIGAHLFQIWSTGRERKK